MVYLSANQWEHVYPELEFDEEMWDWILEQAPKKGFNHILLDVGDGIQYHSHPKISTKNAWSHARVHREIARCKAAHQLAHQTPQHLESDGVPDGCAR